MKPCRYLLSVASFLVCNLLASAQSKQTPISVCAIYEHPTYYHGKLVRIRAALSRGTELSGLVDDHCPHRPIDLEIRKADQASAEFIRFSKAEVEYNASPNGIDLSSLPPAFGDEITLQNPSAVCPPQHTVCIGCYFRYEPLRATFAGTLRFAGDEPGAGFGHLGMLSLHLDITSISQIEAIDRLGKDFDRRCWTPKKEVE